MANKKKTVKKEEKKSVKKVASKKEVKKENEFDKLVEELGIIEEEEKVKKVHGLDTKKKVNYDEDDEDDYSDEDEEYDDEDELEVVVKKSNKDVSLDSDNEIKVLKLLTCISICVSVVTLLISLIVLSKVSHIDSFYEEESTNQTVNSDYDTSMFEEISTSEFIDMFDEDDDEIRFVYTGRSSCSYCVAFLPALQQSVEEYDYTLYYLNTETLTSEDVNTVSEIDDELAEYFSATPMVYAIKNGEVIDLNDGYTEYSTYTSFLEDNGVESK